jgi:ribosomal-protein-alanine N-acetyltransferase
MLLRSGALTTAALTRLADLHTRAFKGHNRGWSAGEIGDLAAASGSMLVVDGEDPAGGFALFRQVVDEAELLTLAVEPSRWNNGVGRALLTEGIAELSARGCQVLFLEVAATNTRAITIYRRTGFATVAERPRYYGADETGTAHLMRLRLAGSNR